MRIYVDKIRLKKINGVINLKTISVYNNKVNVDESNPSFNYWLGQELPYIKVKAIISDGEKKWKETFKVTSLELAEKQIREVITFFNNTRPHPNDLERTYISLSIENEKLKKFKDDAGLSGWLNPEGEFFACEFGEHNRYALEIMENKEVEVVELVKNQHIPLSINQQSEYSYIGILGELTEKQINWLNLWFDKLSFPQKSGVKKAFENQGLQLDYHW